MRRALFPLLPSRDLPVDNYGHGNSARGRPPRVNLGSQMKSKSGKNEPLATKSAVKGEMLKVGMKRGDGQGQAKTAMKGGKRK